MLSICVLIIYISNVVNELTFWNEQLQEQFEFFYVLSIFLSNFFMFTSDALIVSLILDFFDTQNLKVVGLSFYFFGQVFANQYVWWIANFSGLVKLSFEWVPIVISIGAIKMILLHTINEPDRRNKQVLDDFEEKTIKDKFKEIWESKKKVAYPFILI